MRKRIREVLAEAALVSPELGAALRPNIVYFERLIEDAATQKYRLLELQDIMNWKERKTP